MLISPFISPIKINSKWTTNLNESGKPKVSGSYFFVISSVCLDSQILLKWDKQNTHNPQKVRVKN